VNGNRQPNRPTLGAEGAEAQEAIDAVARLVEQLQAGWDQHDADLSNRYFAANVMWGSPFGATVNGYEELHAIHVRLKQQGKGGLSSRFEIVRVLAPAPGVAVAQVRRVALGPNAVRRRHGIVLRDGAICTGTPSRRLVARRGAEHAHSVRGVSRAASGATHTCAPSDRSFAPTVPDIFHPAR
jgi:hypothetical protein